LVALLGSAAAVWPVGARSAGTGAERVKRRAFLGTLAVAAASLSFDGLAQTPRQLIGRLLTGSKEATEPWRGGFQEGMQELGYIEGRDYTLEDRYADGGTARLPALAQELVRSRPAAIVTDTTPATLAAKQASAAIPIIGAFLTDPVGMGLAASKARPGSNVTGLLTRVQGLPGKQLEIARDLVPRIANIGALVNVNNPSNMVQRGEAAAAAAKLGAAFAPVELRTPDEIGPAFQALLRERPSIVMVFGDGMLFGARGQIAAIALASRSPTVYSYREHVDEGGLVSYGINLRQNYRRTAYYVDRILKGGRPADLPFEFPAKLELVINLKTAKALGLTVPLTLQASADEVIE
jgi:putative ABC transport system substrate-binding protein